MPSGNNQTALVSINNTLGQQVITMPNTNILNNAINLDVHTLPAGAYTVSITVENSQYSARFVKE